MLRRIYVACRTLWRRPDFEQGLSEEFQFHLQQYTEDLVASGMPPDQAARRARLEFGAVDAVKDDCREARGLRVFDELQHDLRYALRVLRRTPAFTLTALFTLALCIGANLTIFAVVDSILLRPLPFPDAGRLLSIYNTYPRAGVPDDGASVTNYYERRGHLPSVSGLAIYRDGAAIVGDAGSTEREFVTRVSPEFFSILGLVPSIGRVFTEGETDPQADDVAIVTEAYWRQHLGGRPDAIGQRLRVDGVTRIIVGVLPADYSFLSSKTQIYFPLSSRLDDRGPGHRHSGSSTHMIARLAPGASIEQVQSQIDAHNAAMEADDPEGPFIAETGFRSVVLPLHADHVAAIRPTLILLQAGALFLLLIGAVNVANLLLIRASSREKELAVRQAIGASPRHVVSLVLVESTVLTFIGGLLGLAIGAAGMRLLNVLGAARLPLGSHIVFDTPLALVALAAATVLGLAIGAPVAWHNLRARTNSQRQSESRSATSGHAAQRMRHGFLVAQIALAFVLLAGAGLLGLSLKRVTAVSPGFRPEHVLSGQVTLPRSNYRDGTARIALLDRVTAQLTRQPGVAASGIATNVPFSGNSNKSSATVKGYPPRRGESARGVYSYGVGGDYFAAMGLTLLEGRFLTAADARASTAACVVDDDFARRYWPLGGALGHRVFSGSAEGRDADAFTIVGVVGAVKQAGLSDDEALGAVYYPYGDRFDSAVYLVIRSSLPPETVGTLLQQVVRAVDPELPVNNVKLMQSRIGESLIARRSPALLAILFSGIAILLTAIGTYGVLSYAVAQRRREIGLRMALGARPEQVRAQFVALALRLLAGGLALGVIGAWAAGRAMQTLLFQVPALHLATLAGTAAIMTAVSLAACLLPSRRAARISPTEALADS